MVLFALEERNGRWRAIGVAAGMMMIFASKSRMGLVGLAACTMGPRMMPLILQGLAWRAVAGLTASLAVFGASLVAAAKDAVGAFKGARADSTRVRETLQEIASERWRTEAVWFGHGTVQPGSYAVEFMPIGSPSYVVWIVVRERPCRCRGFDRAVWMAIPDRPARCGPRPTWAFTAGYYDDLAASVFRRKHRNRGLSALACADHSRHLRPRGRK